MLVWNFLDGFLIRLWWGLDCWSFFDTLYLNLHSKSSQKITDHNLNSPTCFSISKWKTTKKFNLTVKYFRDSALNAHFSYNILIQQFVSQEFFFSIFIDQTLLTWKFAKKNSLLTKYFFADAFLADTAFLYL